MARVLRKDQNNKAKTAYPIPPSRVSKTANSRMAGAANSTAGSISTQDTTQDNSQLRRNRPPAAAGMLAIAAAIQLVSPA
jgi:hypothetical protein